MFLYYYFLLTTADFDFSVGRSCERCTSLKRRCGLTKEGSVKQVGKRKRTEEDGENEEGTRRTTRRTGEPEWLGRVLERMDGLTEKVGGFTARVEKLEERLTERANVEKKWRVAVAEKLNELVDLCDVQRLNLKKTWEEMMEVKSSVDDVLEMMDRAAEKAEEMTMGAEETKGTEEGDKETEAGEKGMTDATDDLDAVEETLKDAEGDVEM
jgi:hypothetical protein